MNHPLAVMAVGEAYLQAMLAGWYAHEGESPGAGLSWTTGGSGP